MEVQSSHSMAHVRREARRYFGETLALTQEDTADPANMFFTGGDGYVRLEFTTDGATPRLLLHSRDFDSELQEFARLIS